MVRRDRAGADLMVASSVVWRTGTGRLARGAGTEERLAAGGLVSDGRTPSSSSSLLVSPRSLSWADDSFARRAIFAFLENSDGGSKRSDAKSVVRLMSAREVPSSQTSASAARRPFSPFISNSPICPVQRPTFQLSKFEEDVPRVKNVAFWGVFGYGVLGGVAVTPERVLVCVVAVPVSWQQDGQLECLEEGPNAPIVEVRQREVLARLESLPDGGVRAVAGGRVGVPFVQGFLVRKDEA